MGKKDKHRGNGGADPVAAVSPPKADRSADAMFRVVFGNHLALSRMADQKAHIMIGISAAISAASVEKLFDPPFRNAAIVLLTFCLVAIFFAVLSTMPRLGDGPPPPPGDPRFNLLFFGHFAQIDREEYDDRMEALLRDRPGIHRMLVRDLYSLGRVLHDRKYRYLTLCYRTFLAGLILSALTLGATALLA